MVVIENHPIYIQGEHNKRMSKQYSVYIKDEENVEWIDRVSEEVFESEAQTFRKAIDILREEKGEAIEELITDNDDTTIL